jgi:hypothetical protein
MNGRLFTVTHGRKECNVTVTNADADEPFAPLLTAAQALLSTTLDAHVRLTNAERLTDLGAPAGLYRDIDKLQSVAGVA